MVLCGGSMCIGVDMERFVFGAGCMRASDGEMIECLCLCDVVC